MAVPIKEIIEALRRTSIENDHLVKQLAKYKELYGDLPEDSEDIEVAKEESEERLSKKSVEDLGIIVDDSNEMPIAKSQNKYYDIRDKLLANNAFLKSLEN